MSLRTIKEFCLNIKDIDLSGCKLIDDVSLWLALDMNLQYLNFGDCSNIKFEFKGYNS
jgi:hypothetical protein